MLKSPKHLVISFFIITLQVGKQGGSVDSMMKKHPNKFSYLNIYLYICKEVNGMMGELGRPVRLKIWCSERGVRVRVPLVLQSLFKLSFCSIKHESFAPLSTDKGVFSWAYSFGPHDGSSVFLLPGHPTRKVIIYSETTKHLFVFNITLT